MLLKDAQAAGLEVHAEGTMLVVRGPRSAEALAKRVLDHKAEVMSVLALPGDVQPLVSWAAWLAERVPTNEAEIRFQEAPEQPVLLKLSEVRRYITKVLSSLAGLQLWEATSPADHGPDWQRQRVRELCASLEALREALRPFGLAEVKERTS